MLNSAGNTEARPTNVSQSYNNPNSGGQESGNEVEKSVVIQLYTTEDKDAIEWLAQLENSKPELQASGVQDEASAVGEASEKQAQTLSNVRKARNVSDACVKRYEYRIHYGYSFRTAVCKQGCKKKLKFFQFSNGQTIAIVYDCYI